MNSYQTKKRFGQHFLHDNGVIERIVNVINPAAGDRLVEIGPGLGALTLPILKRTGTLHAIELDRDVIPLLEERMQLHGKLVIHQADALKFDFRELAEQLGGPLRLIGNLPYNVSTPLLFHFLKFRDVIQDMHFMLQKEVVDRMVAPPGSKTYGRLSVMLAIDCEMKALFDIRPGAFNPPPKVDSSIVRLTVPATPPVAIRDRAIFAKLVTQAFTQRRKTIRNSIKTLLDSEHIAGAGVDPAARPETLSPAQFAALAEQVTG